MIMIGPKNTSIRKGMRSCLSEEEKLLQLVHRKKPHLTLWSKVCSIEKPFEDWRLLFLSR